MAASFGTVVVPPPVAAGSPESLKNAVVTTTSSTTALFHIGVLRGNQDPETDPCVFNGTNLTRILDTGNTGSSSELRVLLHGLNNPAAVTDANASFDWPFNAEPVLSVWIPVEGTLFSTFEDVFNLIDSDNDTSGLNNSLTLNSGGVSPNQVMAFFTARGNNMAPSVITGFTEELDETTGSGTDDFAYNLGIANAPLSAVFTAATTNDIAGFAIELVTVEELSSAVGHFGNHFFAENYWADDFWQLSGTAVAPGNFWPPTYWNADYWNGNYWSLSDGVAVTQTSPPSLTFSALSHLASPNTEIQVNTPVLLFSALNAISALNSSVFATTPALTFTENNIFTGFDGYQAGDIDVLFELDSVISVEFGLVAGTPALLFTEMSHTIDVSTGINVSTSLQALTFTTFVTDSRLDVDVTSPFTDRVVFTGAPTVAGIGLQVVATQPQIVFSTATHLVIEGFANAIIAGVDSLDFSPLAAAVSATDQELFVTIQTADFIQLPFSAGDQVVSSSIADRDVVVYGVLRE